MFDPSFTAFSFSPAILAFGLISEARNDKYLSVIDFYLVYIAHIPCEICSNAGYDVNKRSLD